MSEQQQSGLARRPGGALGRVRGGSVDRSAIPVEVQLAQMKAVGAMVPAAIVGVSVLGAAYFFSQALQSSPDAQLIQAQREAQAQYAKTVETVAKNSGCGAFTLICVAGEAEKPKTTLPIPNPRQPQLPQPAQALPDYYQQPQQVAATVPDIENPQMAIYWSSRMHDVEWITDAMDMCERDLWQSAECSALSQAWYEVYGG